VEDADITKSDKMSRARHDGEIEESEEDVDEMLEVFRDL